MVVSEERRNYQVDEEPWYLDRWEMGVVLRVLLMVVMMVVVGLVVCGDSGDCGGSDGGE